MTNATTIITIYRIFRILTTPWKESKAFKKGVYDEKGERIPESTTRGLSRLERIGFYLKSLLDNDPVVKNRNRSVFRDAGNIVAQLREEGLEDQEIVKLLEDYTGKRYETEASFMKEDFEDMNPPKSGFFKTTRELLSCHGENLKEGTTLYFPINESQKLETLGLVYHRASVVGSKDNVWVRKRDIAEHE